SRKAVAHHPGSSTELGPGRQTVIATSFDYTRAKSLDEAIARLKDAKGAGKLIAGGHSLVPLMKLRLSEPGLRIDIARIPELAGIRNVGEKIEIGAGTVHHDVATSSLVRDACPMLADAAASIGDQQVRNRGTLGGSLAHADPAADYPARMLALDADIVIAGAGSTRTAKAGRFFKGLFTVDLGPEEIITAVQFTPVKTAAYAKLHQRASHFAIVGVAAALEISAGVIKEARVAVTGATPSATRLAGVERQLNGKKASPETIAAASRNAGADLKDVNSDLHASEDYRRAMVAVFTRRALSAALERAREDSSSSGLGGISSSDSSAASSPAPLSARPSAIAFRRLKNRSIIRRAAALMMRWPTRAMAPPACTSPATVSVVAPESPVRLIAALPLTNPGRPRPSASNPYDCVGTRSTSCTLPS